MLDIALIRENPELIKQRLQLRSSDNCELIDAVLECDEVRRRNETQKQALQAERKQASKKIGELKRQGIDSSELEAQMREVGDRIKQLDEQAGEAALKQEQLLLSIPNLPHADCPHGSDESANPVVKVWGEPAAIENPLDHVALAEKHNLFSFEDGARIAGSGFVVFRGVGARLERALIQFLLDVQSGQHGYEEVAVPHIIKRECMEGTGQVPKFEDDMYATEQASMFLAPTAEVPVTNLYRQTILQQAELPIRMCAYTPCFRREAGSAGRENKGLIRMHQFDKVELVQILTAESAFAELEKLLQHAETILQLLGLHYRVIELCSGDLGFSATKTYDIEVWAPGHGKYLEVSSCSNFGDYQARRMKLRYKDEDGRTRFCHTLNGSGTALPRLYVALLESWQQPDGSIVIPEILRPYMGGMEKIG